MKVYITAIPMFNAAMAVNGYRLSDQSSERALSVKNDFRGRNEGFLAPGLDLVERVGVEPFAADKPLFVEVNRFQLMTGAPAGRNIPPEKLVCVIPGGLPAEDDLLARCQALTAQGFQLALDAFPLSGMGSLYFYHAAYLMLNYKDPRFESIATAMHSQRPEIQLVVTDVPSAAAYEKLCAQPATQNAWFVGNFYKQPITQGTVTVSPLKINALQLLRSVNTEDFELDDITKIIERDPALSISLLRFINTSSMNISRKIESIQSAVTILGQQEVRRWATVAISVSLAEDRPGEITRLSLVRAKFAESLAGAFELGVFQPSLFIAGLFSLLDVILQMPMADAIKEVAVDSRVYDALVEKKGDLYPVMEMIYAYEHADWDRVSILAIQHGVDVEAVSGAFVDSLMWYQQLLQSLETAEEDEQAASV